jgi:predicted PurR-regulated permease PerM
MGYQMSGLAEEHPDLARITLAVFFIAALVVASAWILQPFLPAIIWATMLVIATWPMMRGIQRATWNSRAVAVIVMTVVLLLAFVAPLWFAISTIVDHSDQILKWAASIPSMDLSPPNWLASVPLIGSKLVDIWSRFVGSGLHDVLQKATPYAGVLTQWFLSTAGSVGLVLLQFLLTVALAAVMYSRGEAAGEAVVQFGRRVAGERGAQSIKLAAQAIRGVALGVVVTAFVQAGIGGLGVAIAGVPFAPILCAIMFMLCIAQIGPALVLIPAVIWMFMERDLSWAIFLLVCSIVAIGIDNIIRPVLIRKGVDLPLLLILAGVIGGLLGFGLVGIFLGPTILAVGYTLLKAWVAEADQERTLHVGSVHGSWSRAPILTGRK